MVQASRLCSVQTETQPAVQLARRRADLYNRPPPDESHPSPKRKRMHVCAAHSRFVVQSSRFASPGRAHVRCQAASAPESETALSFLRTLRARAARFRAAFHSSVSYAALVDAAAAQHTAPPVRRRQLHRTVKWLGACTTALLLVIFGTSLIVRGASLGWHGFMVQAHAGCVAFYWGCPPWFADGFKSGLSAPVLAELESRTTRFLPGRVDSSRFGCAWLPLWIPILALGAPTAILWYLDRRRPALGECAQCGYNLTGNTTGRCPECGATRAVERTIGSNDNAADRDR